MQVKVLNKWWTKFKQTKKAIKYGHKNKLYILWVRSLGLQVSLVQVLTQILEEYADKHAN